MVTTRVRGREWPTSQRMYTGLGCDPTDREIHSMSLIREDWADYTVRRSPMQLSLGCECTRSYVFRYSDDCAQVRERATWRWLTRDFTLFENPFGVPRGDAVGGSQLCCFFSLLLTTSGQ